MHNIFWDGRKWVCSCGIKMIDHINTIQHINNPDNKLNYAAYPRRVLKKSIAR